MTYSVTSGDGAFDLFGAELDPCIAMFLTEEVETDADGYAWVSFSPLAFGSTTVAAEVSGLEDQALTFTVDATDPGASLSLVSGDNQEGDTHEQLTEAFVARLTNGLDDPIRAYWWSGKSHLSRPGSFRHSESARAADCAAP